MIFLLFSLLSLSSSWNWEEGRFGRCHPQKRLESFHIDFFYRPFYQVVRSNVGPLAVGDCVYTTSEKETQFSEHSVIYMTLKGVEYQSAVYVKFDPQPGKWGQFTLTGEGLNLTGTFIDTDLDTYVVIYFCSSEKDFRRDFIEFYSVDPYFDFSNFLHLAHERGFTDDDLYFTIQVPDICIPYPTAPEDPLPNDRLPEP
jgi:hypothetical protein